MARTLGDVVARVRDIVQDSVEPKRYADAFLLRHMDSALLEVRRIRPDLFNDDITSDPANLTAQSLSAGFPLPEHYLPPVVAYVAGMCDLIEEEYASEGRAAALLSRFHAQLGGTP